MAAELLDQSPVAIQELYALEDWADLRPALQKLGPAVVTVVRPEELKSISALSTPNNVLAVVRVPARTVEPERLCADFSLYLDGIRDPGNLGTILRVADWFGISYVFCSPDCVDLYNPKVIQASMGAFLRVKSWELPFDQLVALCPDVPVLGAVLDGENLFHMPLPSRGILVIGNEARGISEIVSRRLTHRLHIPSGAGAGAESLNAAIATGIICAVLRNRKR